MRLFTKKRISIILILILVSLPFLESILIKTVPNIYGSFSAPKLHSLTYTHTNYVPATKCFVVCSYSPHYNYEAKGTQKNIAESIIDELDRHGFTLANALAKPSVKIPKEFIKNGFVADVRCFGAPGDRYYFDKGQRSMLIAFFASPPFSNVSSYEIGCGRPDASYRVEIVYL